MDEVGLDLDPAMIDDMRREAESRGFDALDGYVRWLLERRDTILDEHDVWETPSGMADDPDSDPAQTSDDSATTGGDTETEQAPEDETGAEDVDLADEDGADDDDVAAALEDLDLEEE